MKAAVAAALIVGVAGCVNTTKIGRFVDYPYCTVAVDGKRYQLHSHPQATQSLSAAARQWSVSAVRLSSHNRGVEKDCLDAVLRALRNAGKTVSFESAS